MLDALLGSGSGSIVLVGAPGVGKTRLAREFIGQAAGLGRTVAEVRGTVSGQGIPLAAFGPLLKMVNEPPFIARSDLDLLQWAREQLVARAIRGQLVLHVDDAHFLDDTSALLTYQLVSTGAAFVVATIRAGMPVPDVISALWRESGGERIELQPLSQEQVGELVTLVLAGQVDGGAVDVLWQASAGNVLYLRELVTAAVDAGRLVSDRGVWQVRGALPTSPRLVEIIEDRIGRLSPVLLELAELLAAADSLPLAVLETLSQPATIDEAHRRGLIESVSIGAGISVRLSHPLFAEVVRARTPMVRVAAVRRSLADALEGAGLQNAQVMRYVGYRLDSGSPVSVELLLAAAARACECFDPHLGERFARSAVDAGGGTMASLALADALHRQGSEGQAMEVLETIEDDLESLDEAARAEVAHLRAIIAFCGLGKAEDVESLLVRTESTLETPEYKIRLLTLRAGLWNLQGHARRALELVEPLLELRGLSVRTQHLVLEPTGLALAMAGRCTEAVRVAERGLDTRLQPANTAPISVSWAVATLSFAHWFSGNLDQAEAVAQMIYSSAITSRHDDMRGLGATALGCVAMEKGRLTTAGHYLAEALAALSATEWTRTHILACGALAQTCAMAGQALRAEEALARLDMGPSEGSVHWFQPALDIGRSWAIAARGSTTEALDHLRVAAAGCSERGQHGFEVRILLSMARLGGAHQVAPRLAELKSVVDGPLVGVAAAYVAALDAQDPEGLADAAGGFGAMGMSLVGAEAARASASAYAAQGSRSKEGREAERAEMLLALCEGAPLPVLVQGYGPADLTRREREIAILAASGLTSASIAARLVVSARTVDSHLARIYAKLGVSGRRDLADVLVPRA